MFNILNNKEYSAFFGADSKAEFQIAGNVEGELISGQLDRIVFAKDEIIILDYKNTLKDYKTQQELPKGYVTQLELYKKLIQNLYPKTRIKTYILITSYLNLIEITI